MASYSLMAAAATAPNEASESLKCKTWVLRVSIHCEGCKRKVKKSLQRLEGVYTTSVDSQQHKVTVIGNITSETLLNKLSQIGKHAVIFPADHTPPPPPNNPPKTTEKHSALTLTLTKNPSGTAVNKPKNGGQKNSNPDHARKEPRPPAQNLRQGGGKNEPPLSSQQDKAQGVGWRNDRNPTRVKSPAAVVDPDRTAVDSPAGVFSYDMQQYIPSQPSVYTDEEVSLKLGQSVVVEERETATSMNSFDIFSEENATGCSIM